ncbi:MAG: hypothetical protein IKR85_11205 [Clostridia bacterium]|nr:hypothetical protein [Clostridia bacterium]
MSTVGGVTVGFEKLHTGSETAPVILYLCGEHSGNLCTCVDMLVPDRDYTLYAVKCNDWDSAYSPFEADALNRHFSGNAEHTLCEILETADTLPDVNRLTRVYLIGYSLAGLFSLYAMYRSSHFAGAACCSGTMWFPGWIDFARENSVKSSDAVVYLSLGGKEAHTKNALMNTIEDCTKQQLELLKADKNVIKCILEMNSGGHFADPEKRLAKGAAWLLNA